MVGCEEGIDLAKYHGKDVTVLEMRDQIASDAPYIHRLAILNEIEQLNNFHPQENTQCIAINEDGVVCTDASGEKKLFPADTIILAAGMEALKDEAEALRGLASQVILVGDCTGPAQMAPAVLSGYFAGYNLQRS